MRLPSSRGSRAALQKVLASLLLFPHSIAVKFNYDGSYPVRTPMHLQWALDPRMCVDVTAPAVAGSTLLLKRCPEVPSQWLASGSWGSDSGRKFAVDTDTGGIDWGSFAGYCLNATGRRPGRRLSVGLNVGLVRCENRRPFTEFHYDGDAGQIRWIRDPRKCLTAGATVRGTQWHATRQVQLAHCKNNGRGKNLAQKFLVDVAEPIQGDSINPLKPKPRFRDTRIQLFEPSRVCIGVLGEATQGSRVQGISCRGGTQSGDLGRQFTLDQATGILEWGKSRHAGEKLCLSEDQFGLHLADCTRDTKGVLVFDRATRQIRTLHRPNRCLETMSSSSDGPDLVTFVSCKSGTVRQLFNLDLDRTNGQRAMSVDSDAAALLLRREGSDGAPSGFHTDGNEDKDEDEGAGDDFLEDDEEENQDGDDGFTFWDQHVARYNREDRASDPSQHGNGTSASASLIDRDLDESLEIKGGGGPEPPQWWHLCKHKTKPPPCQGRKCGIGFLCGRFEKCGAGKGKKPQPQGGCKLGKWCINGGCKKAMGTSFKLKFKKLARPKIQAILLAGQAAAAVAQKATIVSEKAVQSTQQGQASLGKAQRATATAAKDAAAALSAARKATDATKMLVVGANDAIAQSAKQMKAAEKSNKATQAATAEAEKIMKSEVQVVAHEADNSLMNAEEAVMDGGMAIEESDAANAEAAGALDQAGYAAAEAEQALGNGTFSAEKMSETLTMAKASQEETAMALKGSSEGVAAAEKANEGVKKAGFEAAKSLKESEAAFARSEKAAARAHRAKAQSKGALDTGFAASQEALDALALTAESSAAAKASQADAMKAQDEALEESLKQQAEERKIAELNSKLQNAETIEEKLAAVIQQLDGQNKYNKRTIGGLEATQRALTSGTTQLKEHEFMITDTVSAGQAMAEAMNHHLNASEGQQRQLEATVDSMEGMNKALQKTYESMEHRQKAMNHSLEAEIGVFGALTHRQTALQHIQKQLEITVSGAEKGGQVIKGSLDAMEKSLAFNKKMSQASLKNQEALEQAQEGVKQVVNLQAMRLQAAAGKLDYLAKQDKILYANINLQKKQAKTVQLNQKAISANTKALDMVMKAASSATASLSSQQKAIDSQQGMLDGVIKMTELGTKEMERTNKEIGKKVSETFAEYKAQISQPLQMMAAVFVALLGATGYIFQEAFKSDDTAAPAATVDQGGAGDY